MAEAEAEINVYRQIQKQITQANERRTQALTQVGENDMVVKELEYLEEDAKVYKLIGPVLVQQDLVEVKANVSKRIEFIKGDVGRIDKQIKDLERKLEEQRAKVAKLQQGPAENELCAPTEPLQVPTEDTLSVESRGAPNVTPGGVVMTSLERTTDDVPQDGLADQDAGARSGSGDWHFAARCPLCPTPLCRGAVRTRNRPAVFVRRRDGGTGEPVLTVPPYGIIPAADALIGTRRYSTVGVPAAVCWVRG
eukprot:CAMPEP_0185190574 /NCGR_PEP_ID=MMETSP1140-20130426/11042_1 /TAXON_ID=298111 /ORGANISM="Pavlova sp., Strain CCMP459" /LENGTH=250 /DNA_ID=CAMNT_0027757233 /DNA_START=20 /DNA_END=770 /DNA_ORIENTATION=-